MIRILDVSDYGKYIQRRKEIYSRIGRIEEAFESDYAYDDEENKKLVEEENKLDDELQELDQIIFEIEQIKKEIYQRRK